MEPNNQKPRTDWHAFTIYAETDDHLAFYNWLQYNLKQPASNLENRYVFYDGDLFHLEEPDFSNWDEIVARQRDKMVEAAARQSAKTVRENGEVAKPATI